MPAKRRKDRLIELLDLIKLCGGDFILVVLEVVSHPPDSQAIVLFLVLVFLGGTHYDGKIRESLAAFCQMTELFGAGV